MSAHRFVARVIEESDNTIHDDDVARQLGFSGALVPGVELFAGATGAPLRAWGEPWLSRGRLALRFRRPVYDGEELEVRLAPDGAVSVVGPDGETRCAGTAAEAADRPGPEGAQPPEAPLPTALLADPAPGPLGTVREHGTTAENDRYLDAIGETLPLYREQSVAHPGLLLRLVNLALMRNVRLGPWIHTSSDCALLGQARLPAELAVRATVTEVGRRRGHDAVRYDAVVLADGSPVMRVDHTALYRLAAGTS
jgi:hypothetical protein